jgi:hypothetical protein
LSAAAEVGLAEAEVEDPLPVAVAVPLGIELVEETWLGYKDPRGLISNSSDAA